MAKQKRYWKSPEMLRAGGEFAKATRKEFPETPRVDTGDPGRRDFLRTMGYGLSAATLAACQTPVRHAIPYVTKPEKVDPSIPNFYATTFPVGGYCDSVVVKTREGRPIKVMPNSLSPISPRGTHSQSEASVLSLYDQQRLPSPLIDKKRVEWEQVDAEIIKALKTPGSRFYVVSNSNSSPSTASALKHLLEAFPSTRTVVYDPVSMSACLDAHQRMFGIRAVPQYFYDRAQIVVSFESNFLGHDPCHLVNVGRFSQTRKPESNGGQMSRLYCFESAMTLTGANADVRQPTRVGDIVEYIAGLYNRLAMRLGYPTVAVAGKADRNMDRVLHDLLFSRKKSIIVCGINDLHVQTLVAGINYLLGNYENTLDLNQHQNLRSGSDKDMGGFCRELEAGRVDGVLFLNCNPAYDHPRGESISEKLPKVSCSVSTSDRMDETAWGCRMIAPDHHYLESWNDYEPVRGHFSFCQPAISPIFATRQLGESLLRWAGKPMGYRDFLEGRWKEVFANLPSKGSFRSFKQFWKRCLHDGVFTLPPSGESKRFEADLDALQTSASILSRGKVRGSGKGESDLLILPSETLGEGQQANNPWLQELPDPVTKVCWGNYLSVSPQQGRDWELKLDHMETRLAKLRVDGMSEVTLPVLVQPGQAEGTFRVSLGYGRTHAGKVANGVGVNMYPWVGATEKYLQYHRSSKFEVELLEETFPLAHTQTHHTYMDRGSIIQEADLEEFRKDPQAGRHFPKIATSEGFKKPQAVSLWKGHQYANHHWGLSVDLTSCIGCGSCTVACQAENNIPTVGKKEVLRSREMHWLRIDRYYTHDEQVTDELSGISLQRALDVPADNPEVIFQPMMCQQCNNAPCETVCPVLATTHSSEGLNQMTYNRCIGTRYCANNCPYKVRRFNWFKFHDNDKFPENTSMNNDLGKMVLNPDVTVRSRGVMEKCTFCVQRIQEGKLDARRKKKALEDGSITTACQDSCPTEALVFGDMKNPESRISKLLKIKSTPEGVESGAPRAYHVLEELRVMPNVWYHTKIKNRASTNAPA